jgi:hypothetical protein
MDKRGHRTRTSRARTAGVYRLALSPTELVGRGYMEQIPRLRPVGTKSPYTAASVSLSTATSASPTVDPRGPKGK